MSIWRYANPAELMRVTERLLVPFWVAAAATLAVGLVWSTLSASARARRELEEMEKGRRR